MKVLIPIAEQHYRSFVTVVDMINRGFPDEQIFAEMKARRGDLASLGGAMVQAVEAMGGFPGSPPEPPPSGDALARFDLRVKVGQNCAWRQGLWESAAFKPLQARLESAGVPNAHIRISQQIQFYNEIAKVNERREPDGTYSFVKDEVWTPDVNGAADAYIASISAGSAWPVPPPLG